VQYEPRQELHTAAAIEPLEVGKYGEQVREAEVDDPDVVSQLLQLLRIAGSMALALYPRREQEDHAVL
jgi:hypothetical protein